MFCEHHPTNLSISSLYGVSSLLVISPTTVVSSANFTMVFEEYVAMQSEAYKEYNRGLSTQPWGAPVLRTRVDERCEPSLTVCRGLVRKSLIHVHRELLRPRSCSMATSLLGTMVLNADPPTCRGGYTNHMLTIYLQ